MKAVVFAAGEGSRLRPLTETRPKPMLPVANRPILEHVITALREADVTEIVLVVGYRKERIQSYFGNGANWDVELTYVTQSSQLGTGHALLQAESQLGSDFIALNGDRIIEPSLIEAVRDRRAATGDIVMAVTEAETPSNYGVVELADDQLTRLEEQPPEALVTSNLINAGVYGFGPDIFAALRDTDVHGELALTTTLTDLLEERPIRPVRYRGLWLDVTTPWDLVHVNASIIENHDYDHAASASIDDTAVVADATVIGANSIVRPNATILPGTMVGENVSVGPNVVLENTIVLSDVTLKPGVMLKDCIVGANTVVGTGTVAEGGLADVILEDAVYRDVQFGGLVGDNTHLGGNVTIAPGAIIGNDVTVGSGATITDRIASDTDVVQG